MPYDRPTCFVPCGCPWDRPRVDRNADGWPSRYRVRSVMSVAVCALPHRSGRRPPPRSILGRCEAWVVQGPDERKTSFRWAEHLRLWSNTVALDRETSYCRPRFLPRTIAGVIGPSMVGPIAPSRCSHTARFAAEHRPQPGRMACISRQASPGFAGGPDRAADVGSSHLVFRPQPP